MSGSWRTVRDRSRPAPARRWAGAVLVAFTVLAGAVLAGPARADDDLIGTPPFDVMFTHPEDTLPDIAVSHRIGYTELRLANPTVDPWLPAPGSLVLLPTAHVLPAGDRRGILINLADQRLYFFPPKGGVPQSFPLGIGTEGADVRVGRTTVKGKRVAPTWTPTASMRVENPDLPASIPPGDDNPLGPMALDLAWTAIAIHGTIKPYGVGRRVSHGCFRLFNEDITTLFAQVTPGTPVQVVDQPVKLGWHQGGLYLEVHPTIAQAEEIENTGRFTPIDDGAEVKAQVARTVAERAGAARVDEVDWDLVEKAVGERNGLPVRILAPGDAAAGDTAAGASPDSPGSKAPAPDVPPPDPDSNAAAFR